jgi:hypothetical protein
MEAPLRASYVRDSAGMPPLIPRCARNKLEGMSDLAPRILIAGSAGLAAFTALAVLLSPRLRQESLGPEAGIAVLTLLLALIVVQARSAVREGPWKWVGLGTAVFLLAVAVTVLF